MHQSIDNRTLFVTEPVSCVTIIPCVQAEFKKYLSNCRETTRRWVSANQFKAKSGQVCLLPDPDGELVTLLVGMADANDYAAFAKLTRELPPGAYVIEHEFSKDAWFQVALMWGMGAYRFNRYKTVTPVATQLFLPSHVDLNRLINLLDSFTLARDLINTPAEDLRPASYAAIAKHMAKDCKASFSMTESKAVLKEFPGVHAVGRAGEQGPCVVDITWGSTSDPKLTLVGKGVCFDSGGLDIKNASGMREMKKDMGGSAIVLAIGRYIMQEQLPIRLRIIIPMVENAIAGNSFRPGDVITMRSGKTVEVGNTDAEGRLILADALALACEEQPDALINFATLTGAARVAMGPDIPACFSNNDDLATELLIASAQTNETICRLPLYQPYKKMLKSDIADLHNISNTVYGGAITAALFLQEFVSDKTPWAHFDVMAANTRDLPGHPKGGEAHGLLSIVAWLGHWLKHGS